jgi:hypothetical protein
MSQEFRVTASLLDVLEGFVQAFLRLDTHNIQVGIQSG